MNATNGIATNGIDSMLAQMRAAMALAQGGSLQRPGTASPAAAGASDTPTDFAAVLKSSLDSLAATQNHVQDMQQAFVLGDDKVSLSDVMIDMQKASISFQTAIQVRNKAIAAYNDIMNMSV